MRRRSVAAHAAAARTFWSPGPNLQLLLQIIRPLQSPLHSAGVLQRDGLERVVDRVWAAGGHRHGDMQQIVFSSHQASGDSFSPGLTPCNRARSSLALRSCCFNSPTCTSTAARFR